jgi:gliding motility-associated-like protein
VDATDYSNNYKNIKEIFYTKTGKSRKILQIIPKTITPNNDNWNDICRILIHSETAPSGNKAIIYSIYGKKVATLHFDKSNNSIYSTEWNGFFNNGKRVPNGLYVVKVIVGKKNYQGAIIVAY